MEATIAKEKMSKRDAVKMALKLGVEVGVSMIVGGIIKKAAPDTDGKLLKKIALFLGTAALIGMISEKADEYVDQSVDQVADGLQEIRKSFEAASEIEESESEEAMDEEKAFVQRVFKAAEKGLHVVSKKETDEGLVVEATFEEEEGS